MITDMQLLGLYGLACLILLFTPLILGKYWGKLPWACKHKWDKNDNVTYCIRCNRSFVFP